MAKINSIRSSRHQLFALRRRQLKQATRTSETSRHRVYWLQKAANSFTITFHYFVLFYYSWRRRVGVLNKFQKNECSRASQENDESQHRCAMITRTRTQPILYIQLRYLLVITTHRKGNSKRQHHLNNTRSRRIIVIQNDWQGRVELVNHVPCDYLFLLLCICPVLGWFW